MTKSPGLSVCMIVKNESANMAEALACFTPFADEIIVVDTGSTDNTKEIAARFTTGGVAGAAEKSSAPFALSSSSSGGGAAGLGGP